MRTSTQPRLGPFRGFHRRFTPTAEKRTCNQWSLVTISILLAHCLPEHHLDSTSTAPPHPHLAFAAGTLLEIDPEALRRIRGLRSYVDEFIEVQAGQRIEKTIDLLTSCGNINLVNESKDQLDADYEEFHRVCSRGIFRVE